MVMSMKRLQLLLVCCSSILVVTSCIRVDGYLCVSAYWNTVTCVLNISGNPVGQSNTTYSLEFTDTFFNENTSCPGVVKNHSYSCVCKLKKGSDTLADFDEYDIKLCHESDCHLVAKNFSPSQNIQLTPPHEIEVLQTPETFNITWKYGYENHLYLADFLDFELLLQTLQSKENRTLHPNLQSLSIQRAQLKPDATYCVKVRSIPKYKSSDKKDFKGIWSKWSPLTCWKNEAGEEQDHILIILSKYLGAVCVIAGVLLFVFYSPAARLKIKTLSHTPSPAPFFQPLYQQHKGNFQGWLSPQGKFVLAYKPEEILTTEAVIVVPKPISKDPEKNQDLHNPSVIQLALSHGQSSYVGLPWIHEASPPSTMVCPRDTSYTQLPCSVWGVGTEVEVVSSPPKGFLDISHTDSGCSCEDLKQSPECSLPNSPVDDSPPPCYCTDYCILNKTAEGFAPVLVSK